MTTQLQEARVVLRYKSEKEASCITAAVSPDNLIPGDNLSVETWSDGKELRCTVRCRRGLNSLISTLDDLLLSINTAEETLQALRKNVSGKMWPAGSQGRCKNFGL